MGETDREGEFFGATNQMAAVTIQLRRVPRVYFSWVRDAQAGAGTMNL